MVILRDTITVDYSPEKEKKTESGIYMPSEGALPFLKVKATGIGVACEGDVKEGDELFIRKESLLQFDKGEQPMFMTKEKLILMVNGVAFGSKVLIDLKKKKESSGIIYEDKARFLEATVISGGEDVEKGDKVLVEPQMTLETEYGHIINEQDIIGVVK